MLLAVGAVRQHLVHTGLRARVGLVAEAGDAFDIHHFATLIGYGAEAVHPWLALETLDGLFGERRERVAPRARGRDGAAAGRRRGPRAVPLGRGEGAAQDPVEDGDLHAVSSYCGAQIFEVLGLGHEVISTCFAGTASPLGGIGFEEIAEDVLARHRAAYPAEEASRGVPARPRPGALPQGGRGPRLGAADRRGAPAGGQGRRRRTPTAASWSKNATRRPAGPRDLLAVRDGRRRCRSTRSSRRSRSGTRFISSAMSLGALSPEAHATLSIAMNRMGARSNSGEGGEDPHNYHGFANGDRADNRIKQVASARGSA